MKITCFVLCMMLLFATNAFAGRGVCSVVNFSAYDDVRGSSWSSSSGQVNIDVDMVRCAAYTIMNHADTSRTGVDFTAQTADGRTVSKHLKNIRIRSKDSYSGTACFKRAKTPIVGLDCSF